jgi:hypothetical protein
MKYTARQILDGSGNWAVWTGKEYWIDTITSDKKEAEIRACTMSARWHQDQMTLIHNKLEKLDPESFDDLYNRDSHGYLA